MTIGSVLTGKGKKMKNKAQMASDAKALEIIMNDYTGATGAHFGIFGQEDGKRHFCIGGRSDLCGMLISEGIANLVRITPGLDETFIDTISEVAKSILNDLRKGVQ